MKGSPRLKVVGWGGEYPSSFIYDPMRRACGHGLMGAGRLVPD